MTDTTLPPSGLLPSDLFVAAAFAIGGALALQQLVVLVAKPWYPPPKEGTLGFFHVLAGAGFQLGLLAGLAHAWFWHLRPIRRPAGSPVTAPHPPLSVRRILRGSFITFAVSLSLIAPASYLWQNLLAALGIPPEPQNMVTLFSQTGDFPSLLFMIVLAAVVAPVTEELIFRVGLYRWLRTRISPPLALIAPAILFASIHDNPLSVLPPLTVLAVVLSLGYARYGHPAVPILAHALFNLNTLALILAGFPA